MTYWMPRFQAISSLGSLIFSLYLFFFSSLSLSQADEIVLAKLHPRQESFRHKKGVLISATRPLDLKIVHIIETNRIKTLDDYARWLKTNIIYQQDNKHDIWTIPQQTLRRKSGDCEDYTFLNMAVLKLLGYKPRFLALKKKDYGHAICAFQSKGYYFWFDNDKLKKTNTRTLVELAKYLSSSHNYTQILAWNETKKGWDTLYDFKGLENLNW